jgi:hypothetical protein
LISDIPAGEGKIANLSYSVRSSKPENLLFLFFFIICFTNQSPVLLATVKSFNQIPGHILKHFFLMLEKIHCSEGNFDCTTQKGFFLHLETSLLGRATKLSLVGNN